VKRTLIWLLALVLVAGATYVAATRLVSPDQAAAQAQPPDPVPVVAALSEGYLHGAVTLSVAAAQQQVATISPPAAVTGVVTAAGASAGQEFRSGQVLVRLDGRPLFVLTGSFALYRDIQPGDSGDDVAALQAGLLEAGFAVRVDGEYGSASQAAVRQMYRAAGYTAPQTTVTAAPTSNPGTTDNAPTTGEVTPAASPTAAATPAPVTGTAVLRSEVLMISGLPATVRSVAGVGTQLAADSALMTLGSGATVMTATVPTTSLGSLAVGAVAAFTDDTGAPAQASVTAITSQDDQSTVVITPQVAVSVGTTYVVRVANPAAEPGQSVLAPVTGIVTRGGRSYIYIQDGQTFGEVEVTVTGAVGGVAAISPVDPAVELQAGQDIRVG